MNPEYARMVTDALQDARGAKYKANVTNPAEFDAAKRAVEVAQEAAEMLVWHAATGSYNDATRTAVLNAVSEMCTAAHTLATASRHARAIRERTDRTIKEIVDVAVA